MFSKRGFLLALVGILQLGLASHVLATHGEETPLVNADQSGVALQGYDTVAYFTEGKPTPGSAEYAYDWQGAEWHFSSQKNRALFIANPEKYAPQYGAFCALGVTFHKTVPVDPNAWTIVDGKLYLNYNVEFRTKWRQEKASHIKAADRIWAEHDVERP